MICLWCRDQAHRMCRGGTWCDCAHRVSAVEVYDATVTAVDHYRRVMMLDPDTPITGRFVPMQIEGTSVAEKQTSPGRVGGVGRGVEGA